MRRFALAALSLAFLATACQPATTELTEEQKAEIAAEVSAINAEWWDLWRAADIDRGMSYFYDSPDLVFAMEGALTHGYADLDAIVRTEMASVASQEIKFIDSETTVLAPDAVCITEAATFTATDTAGVTTPEATFAITTIWMRRGGEWKIHMSHESMPSPEAGSM